MSFTHMTLKILLPYKIFSQKSKVFRVVAETYEGSFGFLPHRRDCVTALSPGILTYESEDEGEVYLAVDEGILMKSGPDLTISVRDVIAGTGLDHLQEAVKDKFLKLNTEEEKIRMVMAKIESGFIRRMAGFKNE